MTHITADCDVALARVGHRHKARIARLCVVDANPFEATRAPTDVTEMESAFRLGGNLIDQRATGEPGRIRDVAHAQPGATVPSRRLGFGCAHGQQPAECTVMRWVTRGDEVSAFLSFIVGIAPQIVHPFSLLHQPSCDRPLGGPLWLLPVLAAAVDSGRSDTDVLGPRHDHHSGALQLIGVVRVQPNDDDPDRIEVCKEKLDRQVSVALSFDTGALGESGRSMSAANSGGEPSEHLRHSDVMDIKVEQAGIIRQRACGADFLRVALQTSVARLILDHISPPWTNVC